MQANLKPKTVTGLLNLRITVKSGEFCFVFIKCSSSKYENAFIEVWGLVLDFLNKQAKNPKAELVVEFSMK